MFILKNFYAQSRNITLLLILILFSITSCVTTEQERNGKKSSTEEQEEGIMAGIRSFFGIEEPVLDMNKPDHYFGLWAPADAGRPDNLTVTKEYVAKNGRVYPVKLQHIPLLNSRRIKKIEAIKDRHGDYDLVLNFDPHARLRWLGEAASHNGNTLAITLDEAIVAWWECESIPTTQQKIILDVNITKELADKFTGGSEENYDELNPRARMDKAWDEKRYGREAGDPKVTDEEDTDEENK